MQPIYLSGCLFDEKSMAARERIGIHHDDARASQPSFARQIMAVIAQFPSIFHENGLRSFSYQAESERFKDRNVFWFREDFHGIMTTGICLADEMGYKTA